MFQGRVIKAAIVLAVALGLAACASGDDKMMAEKSLYDRLGGQPAIEAVVAEFTNRVAADDTLNFTFADANTDLDKFKMLLAEQICEATGGPCTYSGRDMVASHKGMNITNEQFNATGGHLSATLDQFNVPETEKNELLTLIGSMQGDIVGQ